MRCMRSSVNLMITVFMLLALSLISNIYIVNGSSEDLDKINVKVSESYFIGPEYIEKYVYGNASIYVVYLTPKILYVYRNVYLIPDQTHYYYVKLLQDIRERLLPSYIFEQRAEIVRQKLFERDIKVDDIESRDEYINVSSQHVIVVEKRFIYIDLSNKPIEIIVRVVGEVFKDINASIVIYDTRLLRLRMIYDTEKGSLILGYKDRPENRIPGYDKMVNETGTVATRLLTVLENDLKSRGCKIVSSGLFGVSASPIGRGWPTLGHIWLNTTYDKCSDVVKTYVRGIVDVVRKYIPEDVPLLYYLGENMFEAEPAVLIMRNDTTTIISETGGVQEIYKRYDEKMILMILVISLALVIILIMRTLRSRI